MFNKLRHKYDEAFRIRKGYGLSPLRNKREEKALIEFCREQLKEEYMALNPKKRDIFKETVKHYDEYGYIDSIYVDTNVGWYWS